MLVFLRASFRRLGLDIPQLSLLDLGVLDDTENLVEGLVVVFEEGPITPRIDVVHALFQILFDNQNLPAVVLKLLPLQGMKSNPANGSTKKMFGKENVYRKMAKN